ncbi:hypothetical protein PsYK624_171340 [Phanerochaete sordida]|uniref:Uncharacterized protein n=1 Tax=Phanerochaete sordida TaxID=48140 RepID=A0A9P3GYY9_9APHY|nr:hypothetical protein PsYK624_171340 [Phanerochaete sordida]
MSTHLYKTFPRRRRHPRAPSARRTADGRSTSSWTDGRPRGERRPRRSLNSLEEAWTASGVRRQGVREAFATTRAGTYLRNRTKADDRCTSERSPGEGWDGKRSRSGRRGSSQGGSVLVHTAAETTLDVAAKDAGESAAPSSGGRRSSRSRASAPSRIDDDPRRARS